jgi:hypothetical protein
MKTKTLLLGLLSAILLTNTGCFQTAIVAGGGALVYDAFQKTKRIEAIESHNARQDARLNEHSNRWDQYRDYENTRSNWESKETQDIRKSTPKWPWDNLRTM